MNIQVNLQSYLQKGFLDISFLFVPFGYYIYVNVVSLLNQSLTIRNIESLCILPYFQDCFTPKIVWLSIQAVEALEIKFDYIRTNLHTSTAIYLHMI